MKQYKIALVIGRFQPFHPGHLFLIKQALEIADSVIIGIGSSNLSNTDNPYSVQEREEMIRAALKQAKLTKYITKIVPIPDLPDDIEWVEAAMRLTGPVDIVLGNNDWVNDQYKIKGIPTLHIPFYKRHIYEGKRIREIMRKSGKL